MILYWPDLLRLAIVITGIFYGAMMVPTIILHYKAWRAIRCEDKNAGLLPLHVFVIALANAILSYGLVSGVIATFGDPMTWRLPMYLLGFVLGIAALVIMATRQRRRIKFERTPTTFKVEESQSATQTED